MNPYRQPPPGPGSPSSSETGKPGRGAPGRERAWPLRGGDRPVLRILRPSDGSLVGELAVTAVPDVPLRVDRARKAQAGWASLAPADRIRRMKGLLSAIEERAREIEDTLVSETGKPRAEAIMEVVAVVDSLRYHMRTAPAFLRPRKASTGWMVWKRASIRREPLGVVGVVAPWNYPFILSMTPTLAALCGGNAVVLKPSEHTPYSGLLVEDLVQDAGLPGGLVQVVIGGGEVGEALVRGGVDKVVFVGSPETGRRVLRAAADSLTPVVLELGGKDPAIVLADADVVRAARGVVWGAFANAGQSCVAVERVYAVEEVYDSFLREVLNQVRALRAGSGPDVDVGPLTTTDQLHRVERQLKEAVAAGAVVVLGGDRTDPAANVLEPTVLTEVPAEARVLREETFGPILPLVRVRDAAEAVEKANELPFGLSASVWTGDREGGLALSRRLRAGAVCVNEVMVHFGIPGLPFGGVGESGFGRTHGEEGLRELTRTKSVLVNRFGPQREPWWFPYSRPREKLLKAASFWRIKGGIRGAAGGLFRALRGNRK